MLISKSPTMVWHVGALVCSRMLQIGDTAAEKKKSRVGADANDRTRHATLSLPRFLVSQGGSSVKCKLVKDLAVGASGASPCTASCDELMRSIVIVMIACTQVNSATFADTPCLVA